MWDRLVSLTDEIVSTLVRMLVLDHRLRELRPLLRACSTPRRNSIAQGTFGIPAFIGSAPVTARHMLKRFPAETLKPGDIIVTNDPWLGTGHLFDITMMRPVFRKGRIVAYTVSITHLPDIGGTGFGSSATEVYQEGLRLPICKLYDAGRLQRPDRRDHPHERARARAGDGRRHGQRRLQRGRRPRRCSPSWTNTASTI